ncbi:hypothetical protein QFC19_004048 [Naganishia cerealis]|uniref:Uncharacterized protein n=1 Tax=Naganishia cerealis TaxID=610337 RepID=A0ACC2W030_9TREE|nr:hypothetical protein QFC19_004048 [Naganishia cerealis]
MTRTPQPGVPKEVFTCECGQTYSRLEYLKRHQRKHNDDKPFQCTICIKSFARSDVLLRHKRRCHPEEYAASEEANENDPSGTASDRRKSQGGGGGGGSSRRGIKRSASGSPSSDTRHAQRVRHENRPTGEYPPDAEASRLPYGLPLDPAAGPMDTRSLNYPYGMPGLLNAGMPNGYAGGREQSAGFSNSWDLGYNRLHADHNLGYHVSASGQYNPASSTSLADYQRLTQAQGPDAGELGMTGPLSNDTMQTTSPHEHIAQLDPRLTGTFENTGPGHGDDVQRSSIAMYGNDMQSANAQGMTSDSRYTGRHNEHSYERLSDTRFVDPALSQSGTTTFPDNGQQMRLNDSDQSAQVSQLPPHGIEEAAALLSMAYGHVSAIRSGPLSLDHSMIDSTLQSAAAAAAAANYNSGIGNEETAHVPLTTLEELAAHVSAGGHTSSTTSTKSQSAANDDGLAGMTSGGRNTATTYTTILNPTAKFQTGAAAAPGHYDLGLEAGTGTTPLGTDSWDPFSNPLMPGAASPFDISALWASGMITAEEENNVSFEPEGWSHLPGSVPAHTTLNTERPLLRIDSLNIHQRIGKDLDPSDSYPYVKMLDQQDWLKGMGVIAPDATTCTIEEIEDTPMEERDFEDRKKLIVTEKSAMMHSLIDAADPQKNTLDEMTLGIIQALMIYATPLLLSPSAEQRAMGYVKLAYIIPMSRNLKAFQDSQPHMQLYSSLQVSNCPKDAGNIWRDWIKQETIRRVIWMLFFYDTLSCLEMGVPPSISFAEVANLPLPAPDTIWQARSAEDWRCALTAYRATTLDQAMGFHFQLRPGQDSQSVHHESPKDVSALVCCDFGMFGRLVMVISVLRALIQLGQAQIAVQDSVIQSWANPEATAQGKKMNMFEAVLRCGIALKRWRQGWDFDSLCGAPSSAQSCSSERTSPSRHSVSDASSIIRTARSDTLDSRPSETSTSPNGDYDDLFPRSQGKTLFYEEALPFYWLAQALHNILASDPSVLNQRDSGSQDVPPPVGSWNKFAGMDFKQMLQSARVFTRMGEGVKMSAGF